MNRSGFQAICVAPAAGSISGAGSVQTRVEPRYLEIQPFESEDSGLFWLLNSLKGGVTLGSLCTNETHPAQLENSVSL